ncbi:hydrolase [Streptomyces sp. NPDC047017]|uniref:hydrolase n=1 Tax=Streptomyces sp. NPDC047017 TaxID=3155024 RepID=UPI0033C6F976
MRPPHPPPPAHPPRPATIPDDSDRRLVTRLRDPDGGHHAVALLLARHWRATYDYAAICLATPGSSAAMVATAAFRRVLGRPPCGALDGALRPRLLVAARETVRCWAADAAARAVLPELGRPSGGRGLRAVRSMTPEKRHLAERAFHGLPDAFQCLLWHTEVEADPISVPAGLLGIDPDTATGLLEQARERFRAGCVRAHRELAPTGECRFYNRLLDVPMRRGGALLPDVQRHLRECGHCRYAADQLRHFPGGLGVLLAETVLGWGARRYLDSRPDRTAGYATPSAPGPGRTPGGGRHRTAPTGRAGRTGRDGSTGVWRRHRRALVAAVAGLVSVLLLVAVQAVKGWADDRAAPAPRTTGGAPGGGVARPARTGPGTPAVFPAWAAAASFATLAPGRPAP